MQSSTMALIYFIGYLATIVAIVAWFRKIKKRGEKTPLKAKIFVAIIILSGPTVVAALFSPSPSPALENPSNSENPVSARQPPSNEGLSSTGGITIGPWADVQTTLGDSYKFYFCEPRTAISGATCGGLADAATDPIGGRPPYSFVKKSGFLPPGMTLELNGTLRGTPTKAGTYNFRLCAKDLYGGEGCQNLAVVVKEAKNNTTASEPASTSRSFSIDSGSCGDPLYHEIGIGGIFKDYKPKFSGTASGPVNSQIFFDSSYGLSCGAWTLISAVGSGDHCLRKAGDPEETQWMARILEEKAELPGTITVQGWLNLNLVDGRGFRKIYTIMCL